MIGSLPAAGLARSNRAGRSLSSWCSSDVFASRGHPARVQWRFCLLDCIARLQQPFLLSTFIKASHFSTPCEPGSAGWYLHARSPWPDAVIYAITELFDPAEDLRESHRRILQEVLYLPMNLPQSADNFPCVCSCTHLIEDNSVA
jgi:hypothetical protein